MAQVSNKKLPDITRAANKAHTSMGPPSIIRSHTVTEVPPDTRTTANPQTKTDSQWATLCRSVEAFDALHPTQADVVKNGGLARSRSAPLPTTPEAEKNVHLLGLEM